ncbi:MAG: insulinase family protein [Bacilli bacterium]|jgi:predicted Zn-dependent peptidase|nr:insulinase family protein [Bacilli bacterium]
MENINLISDNKFKTNFLKLRYMIKSNELNYNKAILLKDYLSYANNKTKTNKKTIEVLDALYDTSFNISVYLKGDQICFDFNIMFISSLFIKEEQYLNKVLRLFITFIKDPLLKDGTISNDIIKKNKFDIINDIKAVYDDKNQYAYQEFSQLFGQDTSMAINENGNEIIIKQLSNEDLYDFYQIILNNHPYIYGYVNKDDQEVIETFLNNNFTANNLYPIINNIALKVHEYQEFQVIDKIKQAKLFIGLTFSKPYHNQDFFKYQLLNILLGQSSNSYLFKIVREQENLCYSIRSHYDHYYNTIIINAGIDSDNYQKSMHLINEIIDKLKKGTIDNEDFLIAKKVMIDITKKINDQQSSIINYLINRKSMGLNNDLVKEIALINELSLNDLKEVAMNIKVSMSYLLKEEPSKGVV